MRARVHGYRYGAAPEGGDRSGLRGGDALAVGTGREADFSAFPLVPSVFGATSVSFLDAPCWRNVVEGPSALRPSIRSVTVSTDRALGPFLGAKAPARRTAVTRR